MSQPSLAVTFACYNQVDYTRQCVDSLVRTGFDLGRVIAVDNGSSDETRAYLAGLPLGGAVLNGHNLGCGVAWNQGALALQADWTVVMNNDVVVSPGWIEGLLHAAQRESLKVVSPALIEGPLDYDLDAIAADHGRRMRDTVRVGARHAVCMMIHRSVWDEIGYFRATPKLWGYEDTLFFRELEVAGIRTGITGASWLHHFGSVTLSALKRERGLSQKEGLSARDSYKLLGQSFLGRKLAKARRKRQEAAWREQELAKYGATVHGEKVDGGFRWL
ncbi:glycosyltransferase family 2 protein [Ramlibacter humi]|uniref:Glycosyltransferase n=1 Tax=Ramlibacter humi TaxID=2530451 RepID=A0A4Z0C969_9BURK|nr:glycosyltransferase [Ramlibacter humi]TFZ08163.1 glycosyltransferase [Ramlibacter humi]